MPAVLGAGSWGTTLAGLMASKGEPVKLWARNPDMVKAMAKERRNPRYVSDFPFPDTLSVTDDLKEALDGETVVVHAIPSKATRVFARDYAEHLAPEATVVSATKGLEFGTWWRMSEVIFDETGRTCAAVSGPNHAEEVALGQPTAAVIAFPDLAKATELASYFDTPRFKAYPRRDIVGTEVCGAYKNVVALAAGMADGLGWGDNAVASLITLGVDEMMAVVRVLGGDERTVSGLAGVGDLVATATSKHSRNRYYGREMARGRTVEEIEQSMHGMVAEGVHACRAFHGYAEAEHLDLPLTQVTYRIVHENLPVEQGVVELLARVSAF